MALVVACKPATVTSSARFTYDQPHTLGVADINGFVDANGINDPELEGKKQVGLNVTMDVTGELSTTLLTYWRAGNKAGAQTIEDSLHVAVGSFDLKQTIPGSENLLVCQGMYYMWSATYRPASGQPGVFIGQPRLLLPTKRRLPNGQIEQAQCAAPPGPEV